MTAVKREMRALLGDNTPPTTRTSATAHSTSASA
jgi:hypothetical protein